MINQTTSRRFSWKTGIALLIILASTLFIIRLCVSARNEATRLLQSHENDRVITQRIGHFNGQFDSSMYLASGSTRLFCKLTGVPPRFESVTAIRFESPTNATPLKCVFSDQALADALVRARTLYRVVFRNQLLKEDDLSLLTKLPNLESLWIIDCGLSDKDTTFLEQMPYLETLYLSQMPVTGKALQHLKDCHQLTELDLSETKVDDSAMHELANLPHLRRLDVFGTRITASGLVSIAKLPNLVELNIGNTSIDDTSLAILSGATNLKQVYVGGTKVSSEAAKAFRRETGMQIGL